MAQKRIAAIHDISCFGRCSLTVALPIISAAGIETSVVPTAVLSTHTGGFTDFTYRDLTDDIIPIADHWQSVGLKFDALYTGYLGSFKQIEIVAELFRRFKNDDGLILVDPVMADNGELYSLFPKNFPEGMRKLCEKADVIVPNMTEALLLVDEPYKEGPYTKEYIKGLLKKLALIGVKKIVLTGVYFDNESLGAASYDCDKGAVNYILSRRIEGYYHGTGDVFGSALLSGLVKGFDVEGASKIAVDFTTASIKRTKNAGTDVRFGVNFEEGLPEFQKSLAGEL